MPISIFLTSEVPKDIIRLPRPDIPGVSVPTFTFPSGHTSGAVSMWGFMATVVRKYWFWVLSLTIIVLVGLSRIMLGYHFPGDVLGGTVNGMLFLALFFSLVLKLYKYRFVEKMPNLLLLPGTIIVPLSISFIPVTFAPHLMGYLAGTGTGYLLENKWLNFDPSGRLKQHLVKGFIGLTVLGIIMLGLKPIIPDLRILIFLQYSAASLWVTFLAPLIFVKLNLT